MELNDIQPVRNTKSVPKNSCQSGTQKTRDVNRFGSSSDTSERMLQWVSDPLKHCAVLISHYTLVQCGVTLWFNVLKVITELESRI